jgi:hypothetical protein
MSWALRTALILAALLGGSARVGSAQPAAPTKAPEAAAKKEPARTKLTLENMKFPSGAILVICDEIREALSLLPKMVLLTPEEYQAMQEDISALKRQLKVNKKLAGSCKLTGKLDGDLLTLHAQFTFATEQPRTTVVLGLKGAHLTDEGEIDSQVPLLDFGDDGFVVRVEKAGDHQLGLNLRLPVEAKKASGAERGFELDLPGSAVTTLNLELPSGVKEIRWNGTLEKHRGGKHWHLGLPPSIKKLALSWKEPLALPAGSGPLPSVDGQLDVRLTKTHVLVNAALSLEDLRGQLKEWRLLLPDKATVEVKAPSSIGYELLPPDAKNPHHILRMSEANNERWLISVVASYPRPAPGAKLPIGPFYVEGAYHQQGTISIQVPPETLRGQRLIFHRNGEVFQKDLPKGPANQELEAIFQYWNLAAPGKNPRGTAPLKVPLELEIRNEKGQVETRTEHVLKLRSLADVWEVELSSRVHGRALLAGGDSLDVQLPLPRPLSLGALAFAPGAAWPSAIPWGAVHSLEAGFAGQAPAADFQAHDETGKALELTPIGRQGRTRITWPRDLGSKPFTAVLTSKYVVGRQRRHMRVELPSPWGTLGRGSRIQLQADEAVELLVGPPDAEEPVPDRHSYQVTWEQSPAFFDLGWRAYQRDFAAEAVADVTVHERSVQVREQLHFQLPRGAEAAGAMRTGQVRLLVPKAARNLRVNGARPDPQVDVERESVWIVPEQAVAEKLQLEIQYDLDLPRARNAGRFQLGERHWDVALVWPAGLTRRDAKVRVWGRPGTRLTPLDDPLHESPWKDRGLEAVPDLGLPTLVLQARGSASPLVLRLEEVAAPTLATAVCDRVLVRVAVDEDAGQSYRAYFRVRNVSAGHLDLELPTATAECLQAITLDGKKSAWEPAGWNGVRVPLVPDLQGSAIVLGCEYRLAPAFFEGRGTWRTTLHPPLFRDAAVLGRTRWQVTLPPGEVGIAAGRNLNLDYRWNWQGWLLAPRAALAAGEYENWLTGKEADEPAGERECSLAFDQGGHVALQILHMTRLLWLLGCSGGLLLVALGLAFLPLPRFLCGTLAVGLGLGLLAAEFFWPAALPAVAFGCQPGLAVLLLVLAAHGLLQERYRRQITFVPGFTRSAGSSLSHSSLHLRPHEPSTIDAPLPPSPLGAASPSRQG